MPVSSSSSSLSLGLCITLPGMEDCQGGFVFSLSFVLLRKRRKTDMDCEESVGEEEKERKKERRAEWYEESNSPIYPEREGDGLPRSKYFSSVAQVYIRLDHSLTHFSTLVLFFLFVSLHWAVRKTFFLSLVLFPQRPE